MPEPMLKVAGLKVAYGGINAVKGIDFEVLRGELVCLIGANGAGKTTTLRALAGLVPSSGDIRYDDASIQDVPAHDRVRRGLALVPEGRGVFTKLTVSENLAMGAYHRSARDAPTVQRDLDRVFNLIPRLAERRAQIGGTLSGGEQQMLAIGRALMSAPKLLLLDEPSMGLAPLMVTRVFEIVQTIARDGVTILLIEQNANLALSVSQRGYVLESGRLSHSGAANDLLADPRIRAAYLGED